MGHFDSPCIFSNFLLNLIEYLWKDGILYNLQAFETFGWLILRCLDGWTLGVDPSLKLTDFESPLQGGNLESGGSRLGRPYTKKWGKYKLPYPKFHRFCDKTVLQISHNHLLFSHRILSDSDAGGGGPRSVTYFWGGSKICDSLWQGGSKIIKKSVTYFMDGPFGVPRNWQSPGYKWWLRCTTVAEFVYGPTQTILTGAFRL